MVERSDGLVLVAGSGGAPDCGAIAACLAEGQLEEAASAIARLLLIDPVNAEAWYLNADLLERQGRFDDALEASHRAAALWPDPAPLHALRRRLAERAGDAELSLQALQQAWAAHPDDPLLNSEMGASLSAQGAFDRAIPYLRVAAPVLLHANHSIWNYTTALAATGQYRELADSQPLLDRMAAEDPGTPYSPYCHLAAAKLALGISRSAAFGDIEALEASAAWLAPAALYGKLEEAVAARRPFSLIRLDQALSRFVCHASLRAHLLLRPGELSAVGNSVWSGWFEGPVEAIGPACIAELGRALLEAIRGADIVGLPDAALLAADHANFGFLAEMQHVALTGHARLFTSHQFAIALHQLVPFLRPVLQGLPFLRLIGPHPELARRLGHFCGIPDAGAIVVPDAPEGRLERIDQVLGELAVPFAGAVFLVDVRGPHGPVLCARIKASGGIAIDVASVAESWMRR